MALKTVLNNNSNDESTNESENDILENKNVLTLSQNEIAKLINNKNKNKNKDSDSDNNYEKEKNEDDKPPIYFSNGETISSISKTVDSLNISNDITLKKSATKSNKTRTNDKKRLPLKRKRKGKKKNEEAPKNNIDTDSNQLNNSDDTITDNSSDIKVKASKRSNKNNNSSVFLPQKRGRPKRNVKESEIINNDDDDDEDNEKIIIKNPIKKTKLKKKENQTSFSDIYLNSSLDTKSSSVLDDEQNQFFSFIQKKTDKDINSSINITEKIKKPALDINAMIFSDSNNSNENKMDNKGGSNENTLDNYASNSIIPINIILDTNKKTVKIIDNDIKPTIDTEMIVIKRGILYYF